jgi:hypothetical protein
MVLVEQILEPDSRPRSTAASKACAEILHAPRRQPRSGMLSVQAVGTASFGSCAEA